MLVKVQMLCQNYYGRDPVYQMVHKDSIKRVREDRGVLTLELTDGNVLETNESWVSFEQALAEAK